MLLHLTLNLVTMYSKSPMSQFDLLGYKAQWVDFSEDFQESGENLKKISHFNNFSQKTSLVQTYFPK